MQNEASQIDFSEAPSGHLHTIYTLPIQLRWGDMDSNGHINNVNFFEYFQETRMQWIKDNSLLDPSERSGFIIVRTECDYLAELKHPAPIQCTVQLIKVGRSSVTVQHQILDAEQPNTTYARGRCVMVWRNHETNQAVSLPISIRKYFEIHNP